MSIAQLGDRVRVEYARLSKRKANDAVPLPPKMLEFIVGGPDVMPGLSVGVVGMAQGELKHLTLQPEDAYGPVKPGLVKEIPRHQFPKHLTLRVGKQLMALASASGRRRRVRIVEIKPKSVMVDGNHALAGKIVELEVRLMSVDPSAETDRS